MAGAAVSFAIQKIERHLHPSQSKCFLLDGEKKSVYGELCSLESVLQDHSSMQGRKLRFDPLEQQIEDVANDIADLMESQGPEDEANSYNLFSSPKLLNVRQEISTLTEKASSELQSMEEEEEQQKAGNSFAIVSLGTSHSGVQLVGLNDELRQLMEWIAGGPDKFGIISVVGMVGIGKTTLVQEIYNHPFITFDLNTRIMVTIGPNFRLREFLLVVLDHLGVVVEGHKELGNYELGMYLHRFLEGRRYLIVLDDVWDNAAWFCLAQFFPANHVGSRIILTTRLLSVARRPGPTHIHEKRFLDDDDSWNLLRSIVFTSEEYCSSQLEKLGRKIAKNCEGLPLAIVSVGQLLRQAEKTVENWEKVSEDENPLGIGIDDSSPISKSLCRSYDMLPRYLKTCFLYVGVFPRNYEISVSELIRLWVVERFITEEMGKSIEDIAEQWLEDLISRTVVLVHERSSTSGKTKTCRIHFVFRNLCVSIAQKERFCHVLNKYELSVHQSIYHQQRLCSHNNAMLGIEDVRNTMRSISSVQSLLCLGPYHPYPLRLHLSFRLLKVLNALRIRFYMFPHEILELVRLEYLAITYDGKLPQAISKLQNLEVLIVGRHLRTKSLEADAAHNLPVEIWNLKWLRHLQCMGLDLSDPYTDGHDDSDPKLVTLSGVSARSCTREVLARMRTLKKLGLWIVLRQGQGETFSFLDNVAQELPYLESFKCAVSGFNSQVISQVLYFPPCIRKITLSGCKFQWKHMGAICKLQYLKVLKLRCHAFHGSVWRLHTGKFHELQSLLLEDLDMEVWRANSGHFPKLERLIIKHCYKLGEIPIDFGNIESLKLIEVEDGKQSLGRSAEKVRVNHQLEYGKGHLQVVIHSSWDNDNKKN